MPRVVQIDGRDFRTLDEFFEVIGAALIPGERWGKDLTAFNDMLRRPLAHDREPYVLVWRRSNLSRRRLNHGAAAQHWRDVVQVGGRKPTAWQAEQLAWLERCEGPTAFDWVVEVIERRPDRLSLRLE